MKHFYIGCRISEIESVYPSKDEKFPTGIRYKSGATCSLSGAWDENTKKIEAILSDNQRQEEESTGRLIRLKDDIAAAERELISLRAYLQAERPKKINDPDLATVAAWVAQTARPYMKAGEKEALARLLALSPTPSIAAGGAMSGRAPIVHELKCHTPYFFGVASETKLFELRIDDRDYQANDYLHLKEWDPALECYTGLDCKCRVLFTLRDAAKFGLMDGYVIMSVHLLPHDYLLPSPIQSPTERND